MLSAATLACLVAAAPADKPLPQLRPVDLPAARAAIHEPGARAVLVNVWASWCDPCREELPDILRFHRDHRKDGLRLVLISADDASTRAEAARFLAAQGVD